MTAIYLQHLLVWSAQDMRADQVWKLCYYKRLCLEDLFNIDDLICALQNGGTPLHYAAVGNSTAVVELLIRSGADVNARDLVNIYTFTFTVYCCSSLFALLGACDYLNHENYFIHTTQGVQLLVVSDCIHVMRCLHRLFYVNFTSSRMDGPLCMALLTPIALMLLDYW